MMSIGDLQHIPLLYLVALLIVAALYDIRFQKIPNLLTLPGILIAIFYYTFIHGFEGFLMSVAGVGLGISFMLLPYLMGGMGAGDAKLMGAVGGLLGPKGVFVAFLLTALIGGVYALVVLAFYGKLGRTLRRYGLLFKTFFLTRKIIYIPPSEQEKKPRMRYGVAIALGTIIAMVMKNNIYEMLNLN